MVLRNKTILITGGTGSFGQEFVKQALNKKPHKIIIYSRDEHKQVEMKRAIDDPDHRIRFFIGDVRDRNRLYRALNGVDIVIHAAALKHVPVAEYNPFEAIQTNIHGAQNLIDAAIDRGINKVLAISSDKAVNPINLYGATKLCSDKLFIAANAYSGKKGTKFSVIRYGNFAESRGSVIPYFRALALNGAKEFPVTDPRMTRFHITLKDAVKLAFEVMKKMKGGEIFSPRMPSFRVVDIAKVLRPDIPIKEIGRREGEKLHEELITFYDAPRTFEYKRYFVTYPRETIEDGWGRKVSHDFVYNSENNPEWLTEKELLS